jgi:monoterpene epsilon-lactone hydrolase
MSSKQSEAVRRRWEAARLAMVQPGGEGPDDESWGDLTAEPREVDYLETEAGGRPAMWAVPKRSNTDRVLLCMHGGGFVSGSIYTHRKMFGHLAKAAGARALLVGYRLLPEGGVYPAPAVEVVTAYQWLLDQGTAAGHIAFAGDSTGGWLAITAQLRARDQGLPLPAAALLLSPVVDMEVSGESYETNRDKDPFFAKELVRGLAGSFLSEVGDPVIRWPTRYTPTFPASARSTSKRAGMRRCSTTPAGWRSMPGRRASTRGSISSPACCTPSKWRPAVHRRPTTRSAGWPTGYGPSSACEFHATGYGRTTRNGDDRPVRRVRPEHRAVPA